MNADKNLINTGVFTAIAASLCCITPVLAFVAGASGFAATFSWLDPFRPLFIGLTVLVLGFAWYQKLKPKTDVECECETDTKKPFMQSKGFLGIITVFAATMLMFPSYAGVFYPDNTPTNIVIDQAQLQTISFGISGMTCEGCAEHINHEVNQLTGIVEVSASHENENAVISFDPQQLSAAEIVTAINATGYTVTNQKVTNQKATNQTELN